MKKRARYLQKEIAAWPEGHKRCNLCNEVRPISSFTKDKKLLFGVSSYCRDCVNPTTRQWTNFTKEEIESWGAGNKKCKTCKNIKPFSEFHKTKHQLFGLNGECKKCRKDNSVSEWIIKKPNIKKVMLERAKSRAKKNGLPFDLTEDDFEIPEFCPVFNHEFILNDINWTYSLDRIVPEFGYVRGNVVVVSNRANFIKNNASPDEILAVGNFYKNLLYSNK